MKINNIPLSLGFGQVGEVSLEKSQRAVVQARHVFKVSRKFPCDQIGLGRILGGHGECAGSVIEMRERAQRRLWE